MGMSIMNIPFNKTCQTLKNVRICELSVYDDAKHTASKVDRVENGRQNLREGKTAVQSCGQENTIFVLDLSFNFSHNLHH